MAFKNAVSEVNDTLSQNTHYHLADCYIQKQDKHLALGNFYSAYNVPFKNAIREDALFNYAKLTYHLSFNPFNEAIKAIELYISEYPDSKRTDEANNLLVNVYLTTKNYEAALKSIEQIKNLTPDLKSAHQKIAFYRGVQLFNDANYNDALINFDKALTYQNDKGINALASFWKGESYYRKAEQNKDQDLLNKAVKNYKAFLFEPGAVATDQFNNVNYALGYTYFKMGNYKESVIWFRKFTASKTKERSDKLCDAYLRIADGYFMQKDFSLSDDFYAKALEIPSPDQSYALYQRGIVLGLEGKYEEKSKHLKELLDEYAGNSLYEAAAKYELAKSYEMSGKYD
jgi:tetratricopeptide (TPR) repeat protein